MKKKTKRKKENTTGLPRAADRKEPSRGKYADLYDFAPVGYFTFDKDGLIREANLTGATMMGVTKRMLVDQPFSLFLEGTRDQKVFTTHLATVLKKKTLETCELRLRRKDGTKFHAQLQSIPSKEGKRDATRIRAAMSDVTERRLAVERLAHLASFPLLNPNPIVEVDRTGTVTFSNTATQSILAGLGLGPGDTKAFVPQDMNELVTAWNEKETYTTYREVKIADYVFGLTIHFAPGFDVARIYGYDITERKRLEDELFTTSQRLESLMTALPVGVSFSDDTACQRISGNPHLMTQFEIGTEDNISASAPVPQAEGRKIRYLHEGKELKDTDLPLQRACSLNHDVPPMELEILLPSGRRWFAEASGAPIQDQNGNAIGGVAVTVDITHRKRIEEALRRNEAILAHAGKMARLGAWHIEISNQEDLNANPLHWSDETYRIFGYTPGQIEVTNGFFFERVPPEDRQKIMDAVADAIVRKEPYSVEHRVYRPDGTEIVVAEYAEIAFDEQGRPTRIIGAVQDITERKAVEASLKAVRDDLELLVRDRTVEVMEQSRILESFFSHTQTCLVFLDREFNFIRVNEAYARACAREMTSFRGHNHFVDYPSEELKGKFQKVIDTKEPYRVFERPFIFPDHPEWGTTYWDLYVAPILDEHGEVELLIFSLLDVTERMRAEEERARLALAVESAVDAVVITDTRGLIEYVNPAFERITGYARNEITWRDLHFLDSGKHDEGFYREFRDALANNGVWQGRLINKKKDGTFYFEDCTCAPVKGSNGQIMNYVYIKRDVTERLKLESIAESVNTMDNIGSVISGVRHEIGNPVNTAKMILSVLRNKLEQSSTETIREYIDRTLGEMGRVEYHLKTLRNFNLYESMELENMDMAAFMDRFLSLVGEDIGKKGISIAVKLEPEVVWAYADPRALQQTLLNIVTNAIDALEGRRDPAIDIGISRQNDQILIQVNDNGNGITEKEQRTLFRPFVTSKKHGTGLGLVLVKKMLTKMNGGITITSRHGVGTTVDILIPEGRHDARGQENTPHH
ncbi:MAG TPA: PAS domain S-box protein [Nitrospirota bacterium]|nr:PAS domain S-box protein [Nitrospirota bacterium]